jgi:hypothetical protein
MKNPRLYIAIIAGISVCLLLSFILPQNIFVQILGIFITLKIADPVKLLTGALLGAVVNAIYTVIYLILFIFPLFLPGEEKIYQMIASLITGFLYSGIIGAILGVIQYKILLYFKKRKAIL